MPQTPEADENNDLDLTPSPKPAHYAEQALLGALLLEPARLDDTEPLIAPHFDSHTHAALFTAIRTLPPPDPADHARDTAWLNAVLDQARPHAPGLNASYLHTLVQFCPQPKHAAAYARMIRADNTRRVLRAHAERLASTATDPGLPNPAASTLGLVDDIGRVLDFLAEQFAPHPGSLPRTALPAQVTPETGEEDLDEERLLLATATAYPAEVQQMRWLTEADFLLPLHAALWQSIAALVHRGDMVDPVTVLGEAQHRGLLTDSLTPKDLMELVSTPAGSPEYWGEKILQRALLACAQIVAARIAAYTNDLANTPHQLITGSRRALAEINSVRARWHRATAPIPAPAGRPSARPAPVPRAASPPHRPSPSVARTHR
ncbi:DnaB-like helicase N-terminal domain-containing protein [Streptomyces pseudovenezuelae]|uniref:DnaB-like helicase N-terminal domain-containing protein n=1 Tax=Streptomyces pseudovenezuelae TaxID=67350 RepID=UPI002E8100EE|nr:DnaB-like helicase N-terminal domain-containing protein [Streptomyces pseudovenezuelae]WUA87603.1 replicative DNA helicase [Streptomyces pseudovenezuelae]